MSQKKKRTGLDQEHRAEYADQWVALDGDKLVCHSHNAHEVFAEVRRLGYEALYVMQIPPLDELPFGGW